MIKGNLQSTNPELIEKILDEHDCKLSPMDSCVCTDLWRQLAKLKLAEFRAKQTLNRSEHMTNDKWCDCSNCLLKTDDFVKNDRIEDLPL